MHEQVSPRTREARRDVVENLRSALPGSNNGHRARLGAWREDRRDGRCVLRGVDDTGVVGVETFRDAGFAAQSEHDVTSSSGNDVPCLGVLRFHLEVFDSAGLGVGLADFDGLDVLAVVDQAFEVVGTPTHVVLELDPLGQEGR